MAESDIAENLMRKELQIVSTDVMTGDKNRKRFFVLSVKNEYAKSGQD